MELKIQSIHFSATEKLHDFIEKKLAKLEKNNENITTAEVTLRVVKPETANNKEVSLHLNIPGSELHTVKVADTFEEGVDLCVDSIKRQLEKIKGKRQ